jgi:hypothetical protein
MIAMPSLAKQPSPAPFRVGFVIAMRARLTTTARGAPWYEWIIVSRWGAAGEHVSVGRTKVPVSRGRTAPIYLTPRQTALAGLLRLPSLSVPPGFLFVQQQPAAVSVAGRFAPVEGYLQLRGLDGTSRLFAEGRCAVGPAWRVEAVRAAWVGEFIESAPVAG